MLNKFKKNFKYIRDKIRYDLENILATKLWISILLLFSVTILFTILIATVVRLDTSEKINAIATLINGWFPEYSGDNTVVFAVNVIAAVVGVFLTSILIGLITDRLGAKIELLRRGKSRVIERNHIIILGYDFSNHKLLKEIIKSLKTKTTILIVDESSAEEIVEDLNNNLTIPKYVKIVIRSMNTFDVRNLEKCNIKESKVVIITPINDINTVRSIFAIKKILNKSKSSKTHIVSAVSSEDYFLNFSRSDDIMINANELAAKMISVSNKQEGLPKAVISAMSFDDSEFYVNKVDGVANISYGELIIRLVNAVPIGIYRNDNMIIMPSVDEILKKNDKIIFYSSSNECSLIKNIDMRCQSEIKVVESVIKGDPIRQTIMILGYNNKLRSIIKNLDKNVETLVLVCTDEQYEEVTTIVSELEKNVRIRHDNFNKDISYPSLKNRLKGIDHLIILTDNTKDREESDVNNMHWYMKLIRCRSNYNLKFSILAELFIDENRKLLEQKLSNDFIISYNITSMMLAQMAMSPKLHQLYMELISGEHIQITLEKAYHLSILSGTVRDLRIYLYGKGYALLGYVKGDEYIYNPDINVFIEFEQEDKLILLQKLQNNNECKE